MKDKKNIIRKFVFPLIILTMFFLMMIFQYQRTKNPFFLFDLPYIGLSIVIGYLIYSFLPRKNNQVGRRTAQFLVGCYMLFFLGYKVIVNMQIEGFFFYLLTGVFGGAMIHYTIAKVFGPLFFGRGFCGWGCWTAMILDLLPWKINNSGRIKNLGLLRYLHFLISLVLVAGLIFIINYRPKSHSMEIMYWLTAGNLFYFSLGISLASFLKDNRAFCKYACPIPVVQKVFSRFSLLKHKVVVNECTKCG